MPRNGSGVYSLPAGSIVANGETIDVSQHNPPLQDIASDLNTARPISAGGTGAATATAALINLGFTATAAEINQIVGFTIANKLVLSENVLSVQNNTTWTYTAGLENSVSVGMVIATKEKNHQYFVAASTATDNHLITAGGVKLYVITDSNGRFNVEAFGAVGNNTYDCTVAFRKALAAAQATTYRSAIFIPQGGWMISDTIDMRTGRLPSIYGAGSGETIIFCKANAFSTAQPVFDMRRTDETRESKKVFSGFTVRDLTTAGLVHVFEMSWIHESIFRDIEAYNVKIPLNFVDTVFTCNFINVRNVQSPANGNFAIFGNETNQLLFQNCTHLNGDVAIRFLSNSNSVKFLNCGVEGGTGNHVEIVPVSGKAVRGLSFDTCYFENGATGKTSIYAIPEDNEGLIGFSVTNCNFFVQQDYQEYPILIRKSVGGKITGNTAIRYSGYFVSRDGTAKRIEVSNNTYTMAAATSIGDVDSPASANLYKNNSTGPKIINGLGSPEGVVTAPKGSLYLNAGSDTVYTLYVKESGTGNTGWVAK